MPNSVTITTHIDAKGVDEKRIIRGVKKGRKGIQAYCVHNEAYWSKLRKQFQSCAYENSGAYCSSAQPKFKRNFLDQEA